MTRFFDGSLEANTKVTLFRNESVNETTETYIYLQDLNDDGEIFFNVDYETKHTDGSFEEGNGMENLDMILNAYGFENYQNLSSYFRYMFENDKDAFYKVIDDIKSKGIELSVDESEGFEGNGGFFIRGGNLCNRR